MKPESKPLFLLLNEQEQGPFDEEEVDTMLDEGEISPANYGFCEGMPAWRSVTEAMIWSRAPLFRSRMKDMQAGVEVLSLGRTTVRDVVSDISSLLQKDGVWVNMGLPGRMAALERIIAVNLDLRNGHRAWTGSNDPAVADAFPAQELFPAIASDIPRDWQTAWREAGGTIAAGRFIALMNDPVWNRLSDFGVPYPSYSVAGDMWTRSVGRDEAEDMGLIERNAVQPPAHVPGPPWVLLG
jgi:hypothetical protein